MWERSSNKWKGRSKQFYKESYSKQAGISPRMVSTDAECCTSILSRGLTIILLNISCRVIVTGACSATFEKSMKKIQLFSARQNQAHKAHTDHHGKTRTAE